MFKSWRNDRNKIKAVFKLQFQATQVPKLKKPALMISLVPDDVGKPTFKLEKAPVKDNICSWGNPIYVSVKLIQEPKTGIIREKIYHFVVATGSSKSGFLGEASIDFADFLAEAEPLTVSLPLKFANSGAVLHVTIQKMQGTNDLRFMEENGGQALAKEESFKSQQRNDGIDGFDQDERYLDINTRKNGISLGSFESNGASSWVDSSESVCLPRRQNTIPARRNGHRRSNTEWSASSTSDGSYIESKNSPEKLTELEMQSLKKQELSKELSCLKEERDALLDECKQLKLQKSIDEVYAESRIRSISEDTSKMIEGMKNELNCEKDMNTNLRLQLQRAQESNSNFILAVRDLNEMMEQKNREISSLNTKLEEIKNQQGWKGEIDMLKGRIEDLDCELDSYRKKNEELAIQLNEMTHEYESLKVENCNISLTLEQQEHLKPQDECQYPRQYIEELESQIERMEEKMQQQSLEYSECLITINELKIQVKELKKELEEQARVFEEDLRAVMQAKTEQEQRAIKAEEELRRTRWKNAITAERLQKKCKRVSLEVESKLGENEKLTMKSVEEANDIRARNKNLEEMLQNANTEISKQKDIRRREEEKNEALSMKVQILEMEIEKLAKLRDESMATATETEMLIQEWRKERDQLERKYALAKEEAERAQKDLILTRSSHDEKEGIVRNLRREVEGVSQQYSDLQNSFVQEKMDNEALRKQVSNLKVDIQRKEDMSKILAARPEERRSENEKKLSASNGHNEENHTKLLDELAYLKNRNNSMERELKEMEERYSEISLRFAEVEGERQQLVMAVRNLKNGKKN
ncbi:PREDICTED: myosin-4-like [Tarenaya hassleriana]|uniref:myosin-4-like n=1 Tax=Tarenaya hassleriana TaxID=28532 RepID=UPI00053C32B4|nr:PREDICTED: myosin-4-like [Tarenaya hassleriana]